MPMYPLWSSIATGVVAYGIAIEQFYGITYSPTKLVGLCEKSALCQTSLHIQQFSDIVVEIKKQTCQKRKIPQIFKFQWGL